MAYPKWFVVLVNLVAASYLLIGAAYLAIAALMHVAAGRARAHDLERAVELRQSGIAGGCWHVGAGVAALVAAVGLRRRRRWAPAFWLSLCALMVVVELGSDLEYQAVGWEWSWLAVVCAVAIGSGVVLLRGAGFEQ